MLYLCYGKTSRIFKHRIFNKWAKSTGLSDQMLINTVIEMDEGLFDAVLGSGLYKKRVARTGYGKSGGFRTILAFKKNSRAFFMYGYAKNETDNISTREKTAYRKLAKYFLSLSLADLGTLIRNGELIEVQYEQG